MTAILSQKELNQSINNFIALFTQGVDAWIKAGELLVELVEKDAHIYDYIVERCPHLSAGILAKFEQMGRGNLHPHLLLTNSPGFARLQKLPMSLQERYLEEPIPMVVHTPEGTDVMLVKAKEMTKEQSDQVFAPGRIRTQGEQKAWLMEKCSVAARPVGPSSECSWRIRRNCLEIIKPMTMSKDELASIYMQMK